MTRSQHLLYAQGHHEWAALLFYLEHNWNWVWLLYSFFILFMTLDLIAPNHRRHRRWHEKDRIHTHL